MKIKPNPDCKNCHGCGEVFDTVPYGSTTAQLPSLCDCVESQIPNYDDEEIEIDYGTLSEQATELNNAVSKLFEPMIKFFERIFKNG